jgi:NAD(P)-dependent dehydrogenase (short-subunit alcohol dehydrogenase family)
MSEINECCWTDLLATIVSYNNWIDGFLSKFEGYRRFTMSTERSIVLITGANQGIGYEVAKLILSRHEDHYILLGCRNLDRGARAAKELDPTGTSVEPITIDVSDDDSIEAATEYVTGKYGRLDVLINNAGINNELEFLLQQSVNKTKSGDNQKPDFGQLREEIKKQQTEKTNLSQLRQLYRDAYEVNLFGAAATTEAFKQLLAKAASPPRIVFVSSHTGSLGIRSNPSSEMWTQLSSPSFPMYRSSKAALNMLTLHYAAMFKEKGWKVNASAPNLTATGFSHGVGRPASESAVNIVRLATLKADGESGTYSDENGTVAW